MYDKYRKTDMIYRCIGENFSTGILACGFMHKPTAQRSQYNYLIGHYSCFLLLDGSGSYITETGSVLPISPGCIVQRFPHITHSTAVAPDGRWLEFYISFGKTTFDYLRSLDLLQADTPVFKAGITEDLLRAFTRLLDSLKNAPQNQLPKLLLDAQQLVLQLHSLTPPEPPNPYDNAIEDACRMLSADLNITIDLREIARKVHINYETFRKVFREKVGLSPNQYRMEQRITQAQMMLRSGLTIKETAQLTGYSDIYAFTKQFTKITGLSPGRYQKSL